MLRETSTFSAAVSDNTWYRTWGCFLGRLKNVYAHVFCNMFKNSTLLQTTRPRLCGNMNVSWKHSDVRGRRHARMSLETQWCPGRRPRKHAAEMKKTQASADVACHVRISRVTRRNFPGPRRIFPPPRRNVAGPRFPSTSPTGRMNSIPTWHCPSFCRWCGVDVAPTCHTFQPPKFGRHPTMSTRFCPCLLDIPPCPSLLAMLEHMTDHVYTLFLRHHQKRRFLIVCVGCLTLEEVRCTPRLKWFSSKGPVHWNVAFEFIVFLLTDLLWIVVI